ncbi:ABC transporter permease [Gordonia sp. CPCC 206044]|uniref:ABC transporter permease n=1 Tax=Gordonia sp. CPCC 206044 TaxID=3140793 RepID=UPI003AF350D2
MASRVAIAIPLLLVVTFGTYVLLYSIGDPAAAMAGETATPEQIAELRTQLGLDQPIFVQYWDWLVGFVGGDLGTSMENGVSVSSLVGDHLPPTLMLTACAMAIAVLVTLVVGSLVGVRPNGLLDRAMQAISVFGIAVPNFLVGLGLILVFAIWIPLLPAGGYQPPDQVGILGTLRFLVLPSLALALSMMCLQVRTFRTSVVTEFGSGYVRTARMKGASPGQIFFRHVARNASAPLVTVIGLEVGVLITGALIVEVVFAVPGIGTLMIDSVRGQDFPVVQALVALFGVVVLTANLAADLIASWLKPAARTA